MKSPPEGSGLRERRVPTRHQPAEEVSDIEKKKCETKRDTRGYLNLGKEDEMEIFGYEEWAPYRFMTWTLILATGGLARLVFHWWPKLMLLATHRPCPLERAQKILVVDTYGGSSKSYFVKTVKCISTSDLGCRTQEGRTTAETIEIHLVDGSRRDVSQLRTVWVKKLCYVWVYEKKAFLKLVGIDGGATKKELHNYNGYSKSYQQLKRIAYGWNEINVPIQTIPTLLLLEVLSPFYVFQVFALIVWMCDNYYYYSMAIVIMSVCGISSSVHQTYKNQKNLHDTIHTSEYVMVKRSGEGEYEEVSSKELVPGDLVLVPPAGCLMQCDAVLLNGQCIVNESMLTGESMPVTKTALGKDSKSYDPKEDSGHTLFCGTRVLQASGGQPLRAIVIRTGFYTFKGDLVRSILYPPPADFKFDSDSYKFIWVLVTIGTAGFLYTLYSKTTRGLEAFDIIIKALDLFTIAIPPALPAALTVGKMYALGRLKDRRIFCVNSSYINVTGSLNCVCFDKTGTLTEESLDLMAVVPVDEGEFSDECRDVSGLPRSPLLYGMTSCHSLTLIDGNINGDPLDLKMFESTGWSFVPSDSSDAHETSTTIVRPQSYNTQQDTDIVILHQFSFSSERQRMSVVTRRTGSDELVVYCKGSPEMIRSLSIDSSVPENFDEILNKYTEYGYRVIAVGWKTLSGIKPEDLERMEREEAEMDLEFAGLLVMENRLKPNTRQTIEELKKANIKLAMITGDNIETGMYVAKECGLVTSEEILARVIINNENAERPSIHFSVGKETRALTAASFGDGSKYKLAASGTVWAVIREKRPEMLATLLSRVVVFARMTSQQKLQVVTELQKLGYCVGMCGDGTNDCGALKAANVGISLSEAEASVASAFTSGLKDISCVPLAIRQGRAALATSFGVFKFMVLYSVTEFLSTLLLYSIDSNLTDFQFLFIDIALVTNFASTFGRNGAYDGRLVPDPPPTSILSPAPLASMLFQSLTVFGFQFLSYSQVKEFAWYEKFKPVDSKEYVSYENYAVYTVSQFQYIILALVFSRGPPYRTPVYTNRIFFTTLVLMTAVCTYVTLYPADWLIDFLELKFPPEIGFPFLVLVLAFANLVISALLETMVDNYKVILNSLRGERSLRIPLFAWRSRLSVAGRMADPGVKKTNERTELSSKIMWHN